MFSFASRCTRLPQEQPKGPGMAVVVLWQNTELALTPYPWDQQMPWVMVIGGWIDWGSAFLKQKDIKKRYPILLEIDLLESYLRLTMNHSGGLEWKFAMESTKWPSSNKAARSVAEAQWFMFDITHVAIILWQSCWLVIEPHRGVLGLPRYIKMVCLKGRTKVYQIASWDRDTLRLWSINPSGPKPSASGSFPFSVATANGRGLDV